MVRYGMMTYVKYLVLLSRPLNVVIAAVSIFIAALITGAMQWNFKLLLAILSAAGITAGANIVNDIYDVEIDRINKHDRLIPSGKVRLLEAKIGFAFVYSLSLILAALSGWAMFVLATGVALLLIAYSGYFKRTVLLGNTIVSLTSALAFIYGAMAVNQWKAGIIPAVFAFMFHFGREVIKDMQDIEGDLMGNAVTFPAKYGFKKSILLVNIIFILLIGVTIVPYILGIYDHGYLLVVIFGVDTLLLYITIRLWQQHQYHHLGRWSFILKIDMLVGLLAIYMGNRHVIFFN